MYRYGRTRIKVGTGFVVFQFVFYVRYESQAFYCFIKDDSNDEEENKKILLWCDQETFREYKIIDVYKERVVLHSICPGPRVLCTINVGKHVWLGTEVSIVFIKGYKILIGLSNVSESENAFYFTVIRQTKRDIIFVMLTG